MIWTEAVKRRGEEKRDEDRAQVYKGVAPKRGK